MCSLFAMRACPLKLRLCDHQPENRKNGRKCGPAEPEPPPHEAKITRRQRRAVSHRLLGEIACLDLNPHHRQPAGADENVEMIRGDQPRFREAVAIDPNECNAGQGLNDHGWQREEKIRTHDVARHLCNRTDIAAAMRHPHLERGAEPGAEQQRRAQNVNDDDDIMQGTHRSVSIAANTRIATINGTFLSKGPKGSSQSAGWTMLSATV